MLLVEKYSSLVLETANVLNREENRLLSPNAEDIAVLFEDPRFKTAESFWSFSLSHLRRSISPDSLSWRSNCADLRIRVSIRDSFREMRTLTSNVSFSKMIKPIFSFLRTLSYMSCLNR